MKLSRDGKKNAKSLEGVGGKRVKLNSAEEEAVDVSWIENQDSSKPLMRKTKNTHLGLQW